MASPQVIHIFGTNSLDRSDMSGCKYHLPLSFVYANSRLVRFHKEEEEEWNKERVYTLSTLKRFEESEGLLKKKKTYSAWKTTVTCRPHPLFGFLMISEDTL